MGRRGLQRGARQWSSGVEEGRSRRVRGLAVACSPRRCKGRARAAVGRFGGVVVCGIDGRPRSAAWQVQGRLVWAPRRRRGASPSACRGVLVDGRLDGMGEGKVSERAGRAHSSREGGSGARPGSRRSERQRRARVPERSGQGRVSEGEREGREKGSGEREKKSPRFDLVQTRNFQLKLEKV